MLFYFVIYNQIWGHVTVTTHSILTIFIMFCSPTPSSFNEWIATTLCPTLISFCFLASLIATWMRSSPSLGIKLAVTPLQVVSYLTTKSSGEQTKTSTSGLNLDMSLPIYPVSDTTIILSTFISSTADTAAWATDSAVP